MKYVYIIDKFRIKIKITFICYLVFNRVLIILLLEK